MCTCYDDQLDTTRITWDKNLNEGLDMCLGIVWIALIDVGKSSLKVDGTFKQHPLVWGSGQL